MASHANPDTEPSIAGRGDSPRIQDSASLRRLVALARPEAKILVLATLALFIAAALNLSYPLFIRQIVDGVAGPDAQQVVNQSALVLLALFGLNGIFTALRSYLFTVAGERVVARLRANLYSAIVKQEVGFFDERRTGELTNRLASDTTVRCLPHQVLLGLDSASETTVAPFTLSLGWLIKHV